VRYEKSIANYDLPYQLFLASDDPSPVDPEATWQTIKINMEFGIITINEVRNAHGLPPVPWGDNPWPGKIKPGRVELLGLSRSIADRAFAFTIATLARVLSCKNALVGVALSFAILTVAGSFTTFARGHCNSPSRH
jgi:hypothetical protein